jgi:hypothetical protein
LAKLDSMFHKKGSFFSTIKFLNFQLNLFIYS